MVTMADSFDDLLEANRAYAATFSLGSLGPVAGRGLCVVTCMDTRIEPLPALGLRPGDAKILRNAGGRVTDDVLRSLWLATRLLGVHDVLVMHHSGCAMAGTTDAELLRRLGDEAPGRGRTSSATDEFASRPLLAMPEPDVALAADVAAVRECPPLAGTVSVEGWRYDVRTGLVERVVPSLR
jgi:carbonic anhydrase